MAAVSERPSTYQQVQTILATLNGDEDQTQGVRQIKSLVETYLRETEDRKANALYFRHQVVSLLDQLDSSMPSSLLQLAQKVRDAVGHLGMVRNLSSDLACRSEKVAYSEQVNEIFAKVIQDPSEDELLRYATDLTQLHESQAVELFDWAAYHCEVSIIVPILEKAGREVCTRERLNALVSKAIHMGRFYAIVEPVMLYHFDVLEPMLVSSLVAPFVKVHCPVLMGCCTTLAAPTAAAQDAPTGEDVFMEMASGLSILEQRLSEITGSQLDGFVNVGIINSFEQVLPIIERVGILFGLLPPGDQSLQIWSAFFEQAVSANFQQALTTLETLTTLFKKPKGKTQMDVRAASTQIEEILSKAIAIGAFRKFLQKDLVTQLDLDLQQQMFWASKECGDWDAVRFFLGNDLLDSEILEALVVETLDAGTFGKISLLVYPWRLAEIVGDTTKRRVEEWVRQREEAREKMQRSSPDWVTTKLSMPGDEKFDVVGCQRALWDAASELDATEFLKLLNDRNISQLEPEFIPALIEHVINKNFRVGLEAILKNPYLRIPQHLFLSHLEIFMASNEWENVMWFFCSPQISQLSQESLFQFFVYLERMPEHVQSAFNALLEGTGADMPA